MEKSQLRKHLKWTLAHRFRLWRNQGRLGTCGRGVYFEEQVHLMRFPQHIHLGADLVIKAGARICPANDRAEIRIGSRTTVGYHTYMFASERIEIGDDCLIAPFVYIVDSDHGIDRSKRINQQANQTAPIRIGNDVWIGTGVKILKGVTIGDGAVIASGALVKDDVEPYSIVGGIPAKKISERT